MKEIDDLISNYKSNSNSNSNSNSDEAILDFDKMTMPMPNLVSKVKEEYKLPHQGTIIQADVTLFKDHLSNVLATINQPIHTSGCAHLLDDQDRYRERERERVGDDTRKLLSTTKRQDLLDDNVIATKWKDMKL